MGHMRLYDSRGYWVIGTLDDVPEGVGWVASCDPVETSQPHDVARWRYYSPETDCWVETADIVVEQADTGALLDPTAVTKWCVVGGGGAIVREEEALTSAALQQLPQGAMVTVLEVRGRRARITEPSGWVSVTANTGEPIVAPMSGNDHMSVMSTSPAMTPQRTPGMQPVGNMAMSGAVSGGVPVTTPSNVTESLVNMVLPIRVQYAMNVDVDQQQLAQTPSRVVGVAAGEATLLASPVLAHSEHSAKHEAVSHVSALRSGPSEVQSNRQSASFANPVSHHTPISVSPSHTRGSTASEAGREVSVSVGAMSAAMSGAMSSVQEASHQQETQIPSHRTSVRSAMHQQPLEQGSAIHMPTSPPQYAHEAETMMLSGSTSQRQGFQQHPSTHSVRTQPDHPRQDFVVPNNTPSMAAQEQQLFDHSTSSLHDRERERERGSFVTHASTPGGRPPPFARGPTSPGAPVSLVGTWHVETKNCSQHTDSAYTIEVQRQDPEGKLRGEYVRVGMGGPPKPVRGQYNETWRIAEVLIEWAVGHTSTMRLHLDTERGSDGAYTLRGDFINDYDATKGEVTVVVVGAGPAEVQAVDTPTLDTADIEYSELPMPLSVSAVWQNKALSQIDYNQLESTVKRDVAAALGVDQTQLSVMGKGRDSKLRIMGLTGGIPSRQLRDRYEGMEAMGQLPLPETKAALQALDLAYTHPTPESHLHPTLQEHIVSHSPPGPPGPPSPYSQAVAAAGAFPHSPQHDGGFSPRSISGKQDSFASFPSASGAFNSKGATARFTSPPRRVCYG